MSITAQEVLQWIKDNKPGPEQTGGAGYVAAVNWVEQAIRELEKKLARTRNS